MLKIHWNLKNPIKISLNDTQTPRTITSTSSNNNFNNQFINNKQDSFKATSVKDLNEKKCWDDSSLLRNVALSNDESKNKVPRSQSVKCNPNKWKRAPLTNMSEPKESIVENVEDEVNLFFNFKYIEPFSKIERQIKDQMFIPSYGSMSSVCIESHTTCAGAIKILLEKFHVKNVYVTFGV